MRLGNYFLARLCRRKPYYRYFGNSSGPYIKALLDAEKISKSFIIYHRLVLMLNNHEESGMFSNRDIRKEFRITNKNRNSRSGMNMPTAFTGVLAEMM
jgi:hypothetical protein